MLNQINKDTEVECFSSKNLTTFTIKVSLHPEDIDKISDLIIIQLLRDCKKTKKSIKSLNKEMESFRKKLGL